VRLPRFEYLGPETLEDTLDLLADHKDDARILAGGTDLLVRMKKGLLSPKVQGADQPQGLEQFILYPEK